MVSSYSIANSILKKSFEDHMLIEVETLQALIYLVCTDFRRKTGKILICENFKKKGNSILLMSVYNHFSCFKTGNITRFARDANGNVFVVNDFKINKIINCYWELYKIWLSQYK